MSLDTKALFVPSGHFRVRVGIRRHLETATNAGISSSTSFDISKAFLQFPMMYQKSYKNIISSLMEMFDQTNADPRLGGDERRKISRNDYVCVYTNLMQDLVDGFAKAQAEGTVPKEEDEAV
jgi:hypothetical protein